MRRQPSAGVDESLVLKVAPPPPKGLSSKAKREWVELAQRGVELKTLTNADLRALEMLAETLASEKQLRIVIEREGQTISTGGGGRKAHPALKALAEARAQSMRLLTAFGMTPAGRQPAQPVVPAKRTGFAALRAAGPERGATK